MTTASNAWRRCAVGLLCCTLFAAAGSAAARTAEEKAAIEARAEAAQRVLEDTRFYEEWGKPGRIRTAKDADEAIRRGNDALDDVDAAFEDVKDACMLRFLVNSCIGDAKKLSNERQREIRSVIVTAEELKRSIRTRSIEERRAKAESAPKKAPLDIRPKEVKKERPEPMRIAPKAVKEKKVPLDVAPKSVKAPSEPVDWKPREPREASAPTDWTPKEVREPSAPSGFKPKEVREPSAPTGIEPKRVKPASDPAGIEPKTVKPASEPTGLEPKSVKTPSAPAFAPKAEDKAGKDVDAAASPEARRAELERANEAYYEAKQAEAARRLEEAEARAQKRREEREAHQKKLEKSLEERVEAQKRYEESQKNKDSGLAKFF